MNHASRTNVIVVDESKLSTRLGERWPVPLELLTFAYRTTLAALEVLGEPRLRERDGALVRTDAGTSSAI